VAEYCPLSCGPNTRPPPYPALAAQWSQAVFSLINGIGVNPAHNAPHGECARRGAIGGRSKLFTSLVISTEAYLIGLVAVSLVGLACLAALAWRERRPKRMKAAATPDASKAALAEAALRIETEAAALLDLVRTQIDAGERYSISLAQVGERLPRLATPEEVAVVVKFLLAENAKMQEETRDLKTNLEQSRSQIDSLRSNLAEAQEIGMRDPLTSLSNRRRFDDSLVRELADARNRGIALSLVMADIDNFKKVNDLFGHRIGDEILKTFARVLVENVRERDTVARYGGEEFAIILPGTEVESALKITERMRSELEGLELAVSASGQEIGKVTASFGIAELGTADDIDSLVDRADARLYQAKCAGRNRVSADRATAAAA
jgi:diguanylate cyclase